MAHSSGSNRRCSSEAPDGFRHPADFLIWAGCELENQLRADLYPQTLGAMPHVVRRFLKLFESKQIHADLHSAFDARPRFFTRR